MPTKPNNVLTASELRRLAEARLSKGRKSRPTKPEKTVGRLESHGLLHELQVHQIELEMQNAELQEARDRLESLLEKYTDLYDFSPAGYFTLSSNGGVELVNLTGALLVGMDRSRVVGQSFVAFISAEQRPEFKSFLGQVFADDAKQVGEFGLVRQGMPLRSVSIEAQRSPSGRECSAVVVDITERRKADAVLRRNEALFAALIDQAPMGVYVVDASFQLQQVNSSALPQFGQVSPFLQRDFAEIIHLLWPKKVADQVESRFRHTLLTGEPYQSSEFTERRRDTGVKEVYEWQLKRVTLPAGEYGVVCFFNNITERKKAEERRRRLLVMAATNLKLEQEIVHRRMVEISLKQSEQEMSRLLKQIRLLSHKILITQEEERKRISRELHDMIAQTLVGINFGLAALATGSVSDPKKLQANLCRIQRQVEESVEIVHRFAAELRPVVLDNLGLTPALKAFMKSFISDTGVRTSLEVFAGIEHVDEMKRTALFRIVQEALTNVARHAKATRAKVSIQRLECGSILMEITDDGCGFVVNADAAAKATKQLGLLGMKERIEMIGGTLLLESAPGGGTTITVAIPSDSTAMTGSSRKSRRVRGKLS